MSVLLEQVLLPVDERRRLADDIYASLDGIPGDFDLSPEQESELQRRIDEHEKHPEDAIPWEEVWERLRKR